MESKGKQSSVPTLWCVVGGVLGGWAVLKLECSKSHSKEVHFLSLGLENIQPLEIGNGLKSANHRKTQATFRTHWILPSSQVSFFQEKNDAFTSSILELSSGNLYWAPPICHTILATEHTGYHFCSIERRAELEEANSEIDFSTVPTWNPLHIFRYKISWAK